MNLFFEEEEASSMSSISSDTLSSLSDEDENEVLYDYQDVKKNMIQVK